MQLKAWVVGVHDCVQSVANQTECEHALGKLVGGFFTRAINFFHF
jgi:hypothetical protein